MNFKLTLVLFFISICASFGVAEEKSRNFFVIKGKVVAVDLLETLDPSGSDELSVSSLLEIKIKGAQVVHGFGDGGSAKNNDYSISKFKIIASHKESIKKGREIFLLVKSGEEVVGWTFPREVVCFSNDVLDKNGLVSEFDVRDEYSKKSCINSRWYK